MVVCMRIQTHICAYMHMYTQTQDVTHGGQQAKHESAVCPGSDASQWHAGLHQQEHSLPDKGKQSLPFTWHFSDPSERPYAVSDTPSTRKMQINQSEFNGGLPRCLGGQTTCCVKRGCESWGVQTGEQKALES